MQDGVVAGAVDALGREIWNWRRGQQPRSMDDIPRLQRPRGWVPDWSPDAVDRYRAELADFERRWAAIEPADAPVALQVDHRLLGSVLARVRWELDTVANWRVDPYFYLDQTVGAYFDALLPPRDFDDEVVDELIVHLRAWSTTLEHARQNLETDARRPFAEVTIEDLAGVGEQLRRSLAGLLPQVAPGRQRELTSAVEEGVAALDAYRIWLESRIDRMSPQTAIGRDGFRRFLREVALLPHEPEELLLIGREAWARAAVFETLERQRNAIAGVPAAELAASIEEQVERQSAAELEVRRFYEEQDLLSQPAWLRRYLNLPLPPYLEPLSWLGVTDDLASMERRGDTAFSYCPEPSADLPYFYVANAQDPRLGIVHEGAHAQQLALSWAHERPVRRHYYDSVPNEGIAFFNEELMLQAGLFDDRPRSREVIQNFMRLRALRVEIDVGLAIGTLSMEQGIERLRSRVPMDEQTAREEAIAFARIPGLGMSYQIGKSQLLAVVADALATQRPTLGLQAIHDYLWKNGNVPFCLQRWELLGLRDWVDAVDGGS